MDEIPCGQRNVADQGRTIGVRLTPFTQAIANFGQRGALTLTNLIACYAMLAYNMNAYELEAPAHATEQALPV